MQYMVLLKWKRNFLSGSFGSVFRTLGLILGLNHGRELGFLIPCYPISFLVCLPLISLYRHSKWLYLSLHSLQYSKFTKLLHVQNRWIECSYISVYQLQVSCRVHKERLVLLSPNMVKHYTTNEHC